MSDFFQTGAIATLHRLGPPNLARLEAELSELSARKPRLLWSCPATFARSAPRRSRGFSASCGMCVISGRSWWGLTARPACANGGKRDLFRATAAEAGVALERRPAHYRLCSASWMRRNWTRAPAARVATCGRAWATCWRANRPAWLRSTIATSSPITVNCWPASATPWPTRRWGSTSAKATTPASAEQLNGRVMRLFVTPLIRALKSILGPAPFPGVYGYIPLPAVRRGGPGHRSRPPRADSARLGAGNRDAGGGVPQHRPARHLPVRTVRQLRPQAPGTLAPRPDRGLNKMAVGHREILLPPHGGGRDQARRGRV